MEDGLGYKYRLKKTNSKTGTKSYGCINWRQKCPGSMTVVYDEKSGTSSIIIGRQHNSEICQPDPLQKQVDLLKKRFYEAASMPGVGKLYPIYRKLCREFPKSVIERVKYSSLARNARRKKKSSLEKYIHVGNVKGILDLKDLGKRFEDDSESLQYSWDKKKQKLTTVLLPAEQRKGEANDVTVLWYDKEFLLQFGETKLGMDGTYKSRPNIHLGRSSQLLTIMASYKGKMVPIAWALMNNKLSKSYDFIFEHFKENFPNLKPSSIMSDFEEGMRKSAHKAFPDAQLIGCYFHYAQAINKNARKKKLFKKKNQKKNHPLKHRIVKKLIGLALLPENKIKEGFNVIEEECKETFPNDKRVHAFLDYYRKQWLKNPSNFCVYRLKDRTNNSLESYHRTLNSLLRKTPGLHEFFVELLDIQLMARVEVAQLDGDDDNDDEPEEYMSKSKKKRIAQLQELEKAWDQLASIETIDKNCVAQFLNDVSYFPEIDSFDCTPDDKDAESMEETEVEVSRSQYFPEIDSFDCTPDDKDAESMEETEVEVSVKSPSENEHYVMEHIESLKYVFKKKQ